MVDFIDFHIWPVFNLADSAIVIGAVVVILAGMRKEREELEKADREEGEEEGIHHGEGGPPGQVPG